MYDTIIIGSGPAGYTAGIYTSRALLKTLIISGFVPGGQLTTTTEIENFPGFDEGILGLELMEKMKKQAERFGTEIKLENVTSVILIPMKSGEESSQEKIERRSFASAQDDTNIVKNGKFFIVKTDNGEYKGKSVIIATGASSKELGIPTENKFRGKGISYCATCDGFFFKGKDIVVVGGGDTAMEEATFLTKFAKSVTIIHRREEFRASPIMLKRAKKNPLVKFLINKTVEEILGEGSVETIRLKDTKTGRQEEFETQGIFVAIGHTPNTGFLKGVVELDEKGYIKIQNSPARQMLLHQANAGGEPNDQNSKKPNTQTSVAGVFAAGDCVDHVYRQAIVAAGMGCMAALDVQKYLEQD